LNIKRKQNKILI